jgi:hypothetical protein
MIRVKESHIAAPAPFSQKRMDVDMIRVKESHIAAPAPFTDCHKIPLLILVISADIQDL